MQMRPTGHSLGLPSPTLPSVKQVICGSWSRNAPAADAHEAVAAVELAGARRHAAGVDAGEARPAGRLGCGAAWRRVRVAGAERVARVAGGAGGVRVARGVHAPFTQCSPEPHCVPSKHKPPSTRWPSRAPRVLGVGEERRRRRRSCKRCIRRRCRPGPGGQSAGLAHETRPSWQRPLAHRSLACEPVTHSASLWQSTQL